MSFYTSISPKIYSPWRALKKICHYDYKVPEEGKFEAKKEGLFAGGKNTSKLFLLSFTLIDTRMSGMLMPILYILFAKSLISNNK